MPMQQMLLGAGASVATKYYIDDSFSTYLWEGTGSTININNGINLSEDGGMVWVTNRDGIYQNLEMDTELGVNKSFPLQGSGGTQSDGGRISAFNNNGFTMGGDTSTNNSGQSIVSTTFKNTTGFFKIIKYTGNGTAGRQLSHDLGCVPGMICIRKNTTANGDYLYMYHRDVNNGVDPENYNTYLQLSGYTYSNTWLNNTAPTASVVTLGSGGESNSNGDEYLMYLWAGGESAAATACSVSFDGSNDYLYTSTSHSDVSFGTGNFTIELWFRYNGSDLASTNDTLIDTRNGDSGGSNDHGWTLFVRSNGKLALFTNGSDGQGYAAESNTVLSVGQWYHAAITRENNTYRLFLNGVLDDINTQSSSADAGSNFYIGYKANYAGSSLTYWNGFISNVRILKGTALYTSSFKPPTEPLTNITNTKFLWAQSSTVTTGTVNPMTLTNSGTTASTNSPFDDPAGFVFGENADQPAVKVGAYKGNASATGPEIFLGFEPQMILLGSNTNGATNSGWRLFDSMRGIVSGGNDATINLSESSVESSSEKIELTPTGFKIVSSDNDVNEDGENYLFLAIRRSDGYVGKPVELGTDVFAMDTGNSSSTIPTFDSGFPVDFAMVRAPASSGSWETTARLMGKKYMTTNTNGIANSGGVVFTWDSNVGWLSHSSYGSTQLSWMWSRRGQGFDVVTYKGTGALQEIKHNLNQAIEMMWIKNRDDSGSDGHWTVWHKGLNGGTNPERYNIYLNTTAGEMEGGVDRFGDGTNANAAHYAPNNIRFTVGTDNRTNGNGDNLIAMLFASVEGISKVGYYDGTGSAQTITTGFQPRFAIIRRVDGSEDHWVVLDTTRGWGSGDDKVLKLNEDHAQGTSEDMGTTASTGITLTSNGWVNYNTGKFIYYAHA